MKNGSEYFSDLSLSMQETILSTKNLDTEFLKTCTNGLAFTENIDGIKVTASGLSKAEVEAALHTSALSTAQKAATVTTGSLNSVLKGLWVTLLTNPLILVSAAIIAGATAFQKYQQAQEALRSSTRDAAETLKGQSQSMDDYASRYRELHQALLDAKGDEKATLSIKSQLLDLQTELNDKFGDEYGKLNLVTDAYRDQTDAIKAYNKEAAKTYLNENVKGIKQSENAMTKKNIYDLNKSSLSMSDEADTVLIHLAQKYKDQGILVNEILDDMGNGTGKYEIKLVATATAAESTLNNFMDDVRAKGKLLGDEHVFDDTLKVSSKSLTDAKETISDFGEQYKQSLMGKITLDNDKSQVFDDLLKKINEYNVAVAKSDNPFNDDVTAAYDAFQKLKQEIQADDSWKQLSPITDEIFEDANTKMYEFSQRLQSGAFSKGVSAATNKTVTELKAIADVGDISDPFVRLVNGAEKYDLSINDVISILNQLGIVQDEVANSSEDMFKPVSKQEAIAKIQEMSEGFESLDKIMASMGDKNPFDFALLDDKTFKDNFSECGEAYEDFIETISNSPKDVEECQSAFDTLVSAFINQSGVMNILNEDTKGLIVSMLENMGVTNAEVVATDLLTESQSELAAQKIMAANAAFDMANATDTEIAALFNEAGQSGATRAALIDLLMAKINCNNTGIATSGDIDNLIDLANAAGIAAEAVANAKSALSGMTKTGVVRSAGAEQAITNNTFDNLRAGIQADKQKEYKYTPVNYSGGNNVNKASGGDGKGGSGKNAAEKESKQYDWIETALDHIAHQRDKIADIVDDENASYQKQLSTLQELLALDEQVITTNSTALDNYKNQWEEIRKKIIETFGEASGNELIGKIMNGDASIDKWRDSLDQNSNAGVAQARLIDDSKSVYSSLIDQEDNYNDALKQRVEDQQKQFEIRVNMIKSYLDEVDTEMSDAEADLSIKETTGRMITEADYKNMINLSENQIDLYYDQIDALEEQLDTLDKGSAEWYSTKSQIASCSNAIRQCEQNQADWNEEILNLPIRRIERYLELLGNIKKDIQNSISEQGVLGVNATKEQLQSLIDISAKQINKLEEQHSALTGKLGNYEYGSDKFNEVHKELQDVEDEMSSLVQSQREWNKEILNIPINNIDKLNGQMQNIKDALTGVTDTYNTAISAVTNAIDKQVDSLNELKDTTTEAYKTKIEPYQDELDLLNKTNEARRIQLGLEQSQYAMDKANNQKTTQVVRNGIVDYEADKDAQRDANQSNQDALLEKKKYDLQTQIDALEEERDKILEGYDSQIEKLDKIKDKWSQIASDIEAAKNAAVADDIFGNGWMDKVLSGKDGDIYEMLKNNYENVESQKEMYEKQIEANEKISALMSQYIEAYQNGTMTFDQVISKFDELIASAKDGFSAMENLDAILGVTGDKDVISALDNIKNDISSSYNDFKEYLKTVQTNNNVFDKYVDTWEEIKKAVVEQLEFLKKQAEEEAKYVINSKPSSSGGGGSSSSGNDPDWSTPDNVATGPGKESELAATAERVKAKKYESGIKNGFIGNDSSSISDAIRAIALDNLKPNEVLTVVHDGEGIFNPKQMSTMMKNLSQLPIVSPSIVIPNMPEFTNRENNVNIQVSLGDMTLPNVTNGDEFADAIIQNFDSTMNQYFSKVF